MKGGAPAPPNRCTRIKTTSIRIKWDEIRSIYRDRIRDAYRPIDSQRLPHTRNDREFNLIVIIIEIYLGGVKCYAEISETGFEVRLFRFFFK